jgi:carbamoyltransferase
MSAQKVLTSIQVSMVRFAQGICPSVNLCMTGGVALNTLANLEIDNLVQGNIFVYPPSGDAGSSAGAAYLALLNNCPEVKIENKRFNPFLGSETSPSEYITHVTRSAAVRSGYYNYRILENSERMKWVADKLLKREIVALHQSRAEFGPRALGNRSILASGLHPEMKEKLNRYIKKREAYRPYAPAIAEDLLADNLHVSLSLEGKISHPLYYMASVIRVPDEAKELYPSAVHYDNTARVQLLSKELNPSLYELSHILFNACGCGLVLNTSLNLGYEALVGSVESALATLSWSDFSFALLGNVALEK